MTKKILIAFFGVTVVLSAIAFTKSASSVEHPVRADTVAGQKLPELPEHVPYMFLFKHVVALKRKSDEIRRRGEQTLLDSLIKRDARLSDEQYGVLEKIAFDCDSETSKKDAQAQKVIAAFRAQFPGGKVPKGVILPPPPELDILQQERDIIILSGRDRLRAALGEQEFQRFDSFVKNNLGTTTEVKKVNRANQRAFGR